MNVIKDDFTMKIFAVFALLFLGFGSGGLIGFMLAYLAPTRIQLDIEKTAALGAVIGGIFALLVVLHTIYTDLKYRKKSSIV